mgnify:CR=1 FL=1
MALRHVVAREYEYLVPAEKGRPNCHDVGADSFAALREFALSNREGDSPLELMRLCSPRGIGEAIQLQNYVGVVELRDGLQVEVLPKIDVAPGSGMGDREVFARMLEELGTDVSFRSFDRTGLTTGRAPLFEVFVSMFLDEAADLVRRGIRSAYVAVESEEKYVRGKIDFSREARKGAGRAHMTNLVHDELLPDRPENRLVKATLLYLRRNSRDNGNVRRVIQLLPAFEGVGRCTNVDADLARCIDDRSTRAYGTLIVWCRVFLRGESFMMFKGESVATALLFPMERVFQDYVGRLLKRRALHDPLIERVELQATGQWLFEGRRVSLRPDILCGCANGRRVVLDTKWKRVFSPRDLSVADMHQMYAYGQRYRAQGEEMQHVVLLFPWHEGVRPGLMPKGRHVSSDGVQVDMFFFELGEAARSIDALLGIVCGPTMLEG